MEKKISFILPTLNEARYLRGVIASIHQYASQLEAYEIIVVDNGSKDDTVAIAEKSGARVFCISEVNVGALRNLGAEKSKYDYLVFLDADVFLTSRWQERISDVLDILTDTAYIITGSSCGIGSQPGWIEKYWWGQANCYRPPSYINSGHMVVNRRIFKELGAFDETLKTGEDSDFCRRARKESIEIVNDAKLHVIHEGYPKTLSQFFKRERWHGLGDISSMGTFLRSKPALIATIQSALLVVAFVLALAAQDPLWLFLYPAFILPVCFLAAHKRCPTISGCLIVNTALYFIYFWARALGFLGAFLKIRFSRHR